MKIKYLVVVSLLVSNIILSQSIYNVDTESKTLETNFNDVFENAEVPFLVGYSIDANDGKLITMGSFVEKKTAKSISLRKMLDGGEFAFSNDYDGRSININSPIIVIGNFGREKINPDPETAIIFYYDAESRNISEPSRIYIINMASMVQLKNMPFYWLGNQAIEQSLDFLFTQYNAANSSDVKEDLLGPIAVHKSSNEVTPFLIDVVKNENDDELREDAVYWLSYQNNIEAFKTLKKLVYNVKEDEDLREEAVMGLAQLTIPEGFDEVIKIAKTHNEKFLREEAIMWLGQYAVKKAKDELKDIVENEPEIDLKKHALYALSESSSDMLPYLIEIANNSNSLKLKKTAIYLLGDSDDKRAVDALIKLATR